MRSGLLVAVLVTTSALGAPALTPVAPGGGLEAQQARHLPQLPARTDTVPPDTVRPAPAAADTVPADTARPAPAAADTVPADTTPPAPAAADTVPADTVLTPRDRAIGRLRSLPTTPVQRIPDPAEDEGAGEDEDETGDEAGQAEDRPGDEDAADRDGPRSAWSDDADDRVLTEDEIRALLSNLVGYTATEYQGDAAVFEGAAGNRLWLTGSNKVTRDGFSIETDSLLVYAGDTGRVCGYGNPILSGDADPVESDRVCYDIDSGMGMAERARTTFDQGGLWYVRGPENRVFVLNRDERHELYGERTQFTSCDLPEPHYVFQAQSLKMVREDVMVARNVTLRFEDVPVFWLPWMVQSLKPDRRSGLLTPQFSVNDIVRNRTGYNRRISNLGFYWAVSDYASVLVAGEWFSNNYTALESSVTYNWLRQFLQGRLAVKQFWQHAEFGTGRRELSVSTNNSWRPDERTNIRLSGDYITSTSLVRDYSFDHNELNRQIASQASIDRSFGWGSMSFGAQRRQQLTDDQINWTLPSFSMNLRPLTLFAGEDGMGGLTWSGSGNANRTLREVNHQLTPRAQGQELVNANARHSLALGRLSLNQSVEFRDELMQARPEGVSGQDSIPALDETSSQALNWNTSLSFQHTLWAGTTFSPNVSIQGRQIRDPRTHEITGGGDYVAEPNRISAGASFGTNLFGFWPGFGEYDRIRHKISPTLNWSYSPRPTTTALQDSIFNIGDLRERNRVSLSFNQTFEGRVRDRNGDTGDATAPGARGAANGAARDEARADEEDAEGRNGADRNGADRPADGRSGPDGETRGAADADGDPEDPDSPGADEPIDRTGEPRRLPPSRVVNLLSLNTSTSFEYDFVRAREEGQGFMTEEITNSIRSDLVPGLQLGMTHSLFEQGERPEGGGVAPRTFRPYLTRLNASFSIDQDFWLLRLLGLGGGNGDAAPGPGPGAAPAGDGFADHEMDMDARDPGRGAMVPRAGGSPMGMTGGPGRWRASLNYSMDRPRPELVAQGGFAGVRDQQTVRGSVSFRPTEHWGVNWDTSYSFTTGEFDAHRLTLTRDLHRWQANFDFIKAPNGNFAMQFRVHLLDNPDLKLDYDQRTDPSERLREPQR
jgi:hypothetical protein